MKVNLNKKNDTRQSPQSCDLKEASDNESISESNELTEVQKEFLELIESKLKKAEKETWLIKDRYQDPLLKTH